MRLSLSLPVSFLLLSSHFNFAEGGKERATKKGKKYSTDKPEKDAAAEKDIENNVFLRGNDVSDIIDDETEGDYIVVFKKNKIRNEKTEADVLTKKVNGKLKKTYSKEVLQGFSARLTRKAMNELQNNPDVDYIEEDIQVTISDCTTTTQSSSLSWGLDRIDFAATSPTSKLDGEYSYVVDGPAHEVHVYVIDTGINSLHNEFVGRLGDGFGAIDNADGPSGSWEDCHGHGTHVAGTIGGTLYGVAKNANIVLHAVRVLNCKGRGSMSDILEAYDWVANQCVDKICVANGSFGGGFSQANNDGADSMVAAGVVFAVAAGNDNIDACQLSPASAEGVITVGATTQTDARSGFSCYGECVEIFAPGSAIKSAWIGGTSNTNTISGTSMASPHVAGVAALIRQLNPTLTPAEVARMINMQALSDVIIDVGPGSPNKLLQVPYLDCELPSLPPPTDAPTFAPTSCVHMFQLKLLTDRYASETSWDLKNPSGRIVAQGLGYDNESLYTENVCIDNGEYTFTIHDSYGDGICCGYGSGSYSVLFNGVQVTLENTGSFAGIESTSFGQEASVPPLLEPSASPSSPPSSKPSTRVPSISPSVEPSLSSLMPSSPPSVSPTSSPSDSPSTSPSFPSPSSPPSSKPSTTRVLSLSPSVETSTTSSLTPSSPPSVAPTSSPSKAPSPSPSSSPSSVPSSSIHSFQLELWTDRYAAETSWDLKDSSGSIVVSGSGYDNESFYTENEWIEDGEYTFTIHDSYGDGICCGYGSGSYSVLLDGVQVTPAENSGSFASSESTSFGEDATLLDPSSSPSKKPSSSSCIHSFQLDLWTDRYAAETSWDLRDSSGSVVVAGSDYDNESFYTENECIDDGEYTFTIYDSYGDGVCCGYGSGSYSVLFDEVQVTQENSGSFASSESTSFGGDARTLLELSSSRSFPVPVLSPSTTSQSSSTWTEIFSNDFENGWGNFNDGGKGAFMNSRWSHGNGSYSAKIRNDLNEKSNIYSDPFPVLNYSTIKVEFWYLSRGFDYNNDESFYLETDATGSDNWSTVYTWIHGEKAFASNAEWRYASVDVPVSSSDLQIRFRNNGDTRHEQLFIDEVVVSGKR